MSLINITIKAYDNAKLDELISVTKMIGEKMATQGDINALTLQVNKVFGEVQSAKQVLVDKIAELQAIIDSGQPVLDLSGLQSAVQVLDDINPDGPV